VARPHRVRRSAGTAFWHNCRNLIPLSHITRKLRAILASDTDQTLVRARATGERLVAALRMGLIALIVVSALPETLSGTQQGFRMGLTVGGLAYGGAMLWLAFRIPRRWFAWMSCGMDVSLASITLTLFVFGNEPLAALNNRFLFETYYFTLISSVLRYDWRLCAFTTLLALAEYVGLASYITAHWDVENLVSAEFGHFFPSGHLNRLLLFAASGVTASTVAQWARHLRLLIGTDHLTGLSQRRPFLERIEEELARSLPRHSTLSVALFDLDHFKQFNDTHGHLAGDRALQLLASRLRSSVRTTDLVARFGGEEFVVAFPRMDVELATKRVEDLRAELGQISIPAGGEVHRLTVSAGVASWPADGDTFDAVLEKADERLYEAKRTGRNRVVGPRSVQLASVTQLPTGR
jgi:two-component system cell cycle response regulator